MLKQWVTGAQSPGAVLFEWDRPFDLWSYSATHSQLLLRSPRYDPEVDPDLDPEDLRPDGNPPVDKWPRTRIDLLFKGVDALHLRTLAYPALRVRVAATPGRWIYRGRRRGLGTESLRH